MGKLKPFVVKSSSKLSIVNVEIIIQVWGGGCSLRCFLYFKFTWIDNTKYSANLCFSETIHHLYFCRWNWNCCARCFLPALRGLCTNSASYEYKNKSASNGAQLVPIGIPVVCWNIHPPNSLWQMHLSIFVVHQSDYERSMCLCSQWQHTESDGYHIYGRNTGW